MARPMSFEAFVKTAHDSGDGMTVYHCFACGSGQVIARSDNSVECQFCGVCFSVQVQPQFSGFPQTIDGQPVQVPGIPGSGAQPAGPPQQAFGDDQDPGSGDDSGDTPFPDPQGEDDENDDDSDTDPGGRGQQTSFGGAA